MLRIAKNCVNKILSNANLELRKINAFSSVESQLIKLVKQFEVDLIVDVGANTGQFAHSIRAGGYSGRIVSFEPLPKAHRSLVQNAQNDQNWTIAPRMALGSMREDSTINVSGNSVSSSLLKITDAHIKAALTSATTESCPVEIHTLDEVMLSIGAGSANSILLKIDTQGFELAVLEGASSTLQRCNVLMTEASCVELYEQQPLLPDVLNFVKRKDFGLYSIVPEFVDPGSGRILQSNLVFTRNPALPVSRN